MGNIKHTQPAKIYRKDKGTTELMQINLWIGQAQDNLTHPRLENNWIGTLIHF
jgi:hypothetical protein